jgi:hypothetical protein
MVLSKCQKNLWDYFVCPEGKYSGGDGSHHYFSELLWEISDRPLYCISELRLETQPYLQ